MIITKARVISGGSGFKIGDILTVKSPDLKSSDTVLKVTGVGNNGSIKTLEIIKYGYGQSFLSRLFIAGNTYTVTVPSSVYNFRIDPDVDIVCGELDNPDNADFILKENHGLLDGEEISYTVINGSPIYGIIPFNRYRAKVINDDKFQITDLDGNLINILWIGLASTSIPTSYDYTTTDVDDNPIDNQHYFFRPSETTTITFTNGDLIIEFDTGNLCYYRGYYENGNNILGDQIFVQDSFYYQAFSYVTALAKTIDDYGAILRDVIHPGGTKHFARYDIFNQFSIDIISETDATLLKRPDSFYDIATVTDQISSFSVDKYPDGESVTLSQGGAVYCEPFYVETPYLTSYWEAGYLNKEQSFIS